MSTGKSPFITAHCTVAMSPAFAASSPNVNGAICGATAIARVYHVEVLYVEILDVCHVGMRIMVMYTRKL